MDVKESGGCTVAFWGSIKNAFVSIIPHGSRHQEGQQRRSGFDAEGDELEVYCTPGPVTVEKAQGQVFVPATTIEPPVGMDDYYPGAVEELRSGEVQVKADDNANITHNQQLQQQEQQEQQEPCQKEPVDPGIVAPPPSATGLRESDEDNTQQQPVTTQKTADMNTLEDDDKDETVSNASPPCPSSPPPQPQGCTSCPRVEVQRQMNIPVSGSPLGTQLDLSLPCVELE